MTTNHLESKLLFDKYPLVINPSLAALIGLNEAIILQQIHYWLVLNKKTEKNYYEGRYWTYNTYEDWKWQFPFWSMKTIQRTIKKLESKRYIISSNFNSSKMDRTKWYSIDYDEIEKLNSLVWQPYKGAAKYPYPFSQNGEMQDEEINNASG